MSDVIVDALAAHADSGTTAMDAMGNTVVMAEDAATNLTDGGTETVEPVATATDTAPDGTPATAAAVAQDEIDKLLEKEGYKPQVGRENRIPYSRTKKIIENAQKEWKAAQEAASAEERKRLSDFEERLKHYDAQERLASSDPDRFIMALAAADPRFAKYVGQGLTAGQAQAAVAKEEDNDPEPQPDKDPTTGQMYYTPEKWKEVQEWGRRQAVKEATALMEQKYGSVLTKQMERERAAAEYEARRPVVEGQLARLNETYGAEMVKANEAEIVKVMQAFQAKGTPIAVSEAAAMVLIPKLRQDEAAVRTKVIEEINKRPAAAQRSGATQTKDVAPPTELTGEAVIKAALDKAFPNRHVA